MKRLRACLLRHRAMALTVIALVGLAMQPGAVRRTPARPGPPLRAPPVLG